MNILYTTPVLLHPAAGGPALRVENSIKALNRISKLYIIARLSRTQIGGKMAEEFFRQLSYKFEFAPSVVLNNRFPNVTFSTKYIRGVVNLCIRAIRKIIRLLFRVDDVGYLCEYIEKHNIDIVWFGYGNISYDLMKKLKKRLPEIKMVCDTDSVWSRFLLRELPYENNPTRKKEIEKKGKRKKIEEKHWVEFMDVTTAVSEFDAEYYRRIATDVNCVQLFSNVVDLDMYSIKPQPPEKFVKPCIYLAGSFWERCPMEHAARWVIKNVFPLVRQAIPDVHFYIIGKNSDIILADIADSSITITGMLDSVLPYLCNADVALVPLFFESGTRFKILEAGACGIPLVSTTLGAEGIPVTNGQQILIADEADKFAAAIINIIRNRELADKLARNCKDLIQKQYSIDVLVADAKTIVNYLTT